MTIPAAFLLIVTGVLIYFLVRPEVRYVKATHWPEIPVAELQRYLQRAGIKQLEKFPRSSYRIYPDTQTVALDPNDPFTRAVIDELHVAGLL